MQFYFSVLVYFNSFDHQIKDYCQPPSSDGQRLTNMSLQKIFKVLSSLSGIFFAVLCAFCFAVEDMLLYGTSEVASPALIFVFGSTVAFVLSILVAVVRRPRTNFVSSRSHTGLVLLHGMLNCFTQITISIAIFILGPGNAVALVFTMPIFSNIFNTVCFGNKCIKSSVLFTVLSFFGVGLVTRPSFATGEVENYLQETLFIKILGVISGITGAITFSCALFVGRNLSELGTDTLITVLSYSSQYTIVSVTLCSVLSSWRLPSNVGTLVALSATGFITLFGMTFHFLAVSFEKPVVVSVILTLHVVFAFAGQYILFEFPFHWSIGVGSGLIIVSCIGITVLSDRDNNTQEDTEGDGEIILDPEEMLPILEDISLSNSLQHGRLQK